MKVRKHPPKSVKGPDGDTLVWCSGHKKYLPEDAFYKVSGRRYDTYCSECRRAKEKSFYYRFKHNNKDYVPHIRRIDNARYFDAMHEELKQKRAAQEKEQILAQKVKQTTHDVAGRPLLIRRQIQEDFS